VRDIRERRQMEEKLQEMARMESVGRLAGGVAHDFNNLLTVIAGYTQGLKRITSGEARDRVDQIRAASDRAAALVRQLLAFSRKQPLQPQPLDLNLVIRNMADMIRGVLNEPILLVLDLAPILGSVEADPHQLEQIILNLATNARDAMAEGGQLVIKTWNEPVAGAIPQADPPAGYVGLSITDTGQGMDQATQSRVFEPFFSTKPLYKGTGLGLATVYGTVKQSRGHISVQSEVGRGTTFTILLPCTRDTARRDFDGRPVDDARGNETILLVEDDAAVRGVLVHGLEQEGYRVLSAGNGREALELFSDRGAEIELIVTDLIMPEMGGIPLGEHLRDTGATLPILYISGYHQDMEKHSAVDLPLSRGFLLKPFNPQALAMAIRRTLTVQAKAASAKAQS
jgi:CheY-like chemotaxis protein